MKNINKCITILCVIVMCTMIISCANTYNRAAKQYSGNRRETTSFCQVQLVYDQRDQILADNYITKYNLQYYGSTHFDASTKFSKNT